MGLSNVLIFMIRMVHESPYCTIMFSLSINLHVFYLNMYVSCSMREPPGVKMINHLPRLTENLIGGEYIANVRIFPTAFTLERIYAMSVPILCYVHSAYHSRFVSSAWVHIDESRDPLFRAKKWSNISYT